MPLSALLSPGSPALRLAEAFERAGHELYLVGGTVRDALLERPQGGDLDFATDATPEQTKAVVAPMAANVWLQGARYGTVGAEIDGEATEITTFRSERYQPSSRHPEVHFESSIETDLARRDFTINALAVRLPALDPIDLFGGLKDLKAKVIRTPGSPEDSFTDDPLRMLRAFRFASQLAFAIDRSVVEAVSRLKHLIGTVSAERIADELSKLLLGSMAGDALALAERTGLTELFLPELTALKVEQDPVHRHKDVFAHTLAVLDRAEPRLDVRLAALLHDICKPKTRRIGPDGVSFHHHEIVGAEMAEARLRALRFPNEIVDAVASMIRLHHRFHTYRLGWTDAAVRRYVRDAGPLLKPLNALVRADCTTRNADKARRLAARMDELEARIDDLAQREEMERIRPELDGFQVMSYLGVAPGRVVGEALAYLLEIRLDEGLIGADECFKRLDAWARERGIEPQGEKVEPRAKKGEE